MRAFTYQNAHSLENFQIKQSDVPVPVVGDNDVLVEIKAVSFNPVDTKIRQSRSASKPEGVILGWDAAGVIQELGANVENFKIGDEVYYAGDLTRDGSNADFQAVDYRLIAHKPKNLDFNDAASLPLTALTAQEALFERGIEYNENTKVLIIGGAGGVGSVAIQLLKARTKAQIIAMASRTETIDWVKKMGADHVIGRDLEAELEQFGPIDVVFSTTHTDSYLSIIPNIMRPFGHFILIDDPKALDIVPLKAKALSVHWEFMFSKSMFSYKMQEQGAFLADLAKLVEAKKILPTITRTLTFEEKSIKEAHTLLESGKSYGKIVMSL